MIIGALNQSISKKTQIHVENPAIGYTELTTLQHIMQIKESLKLLMLSPYHENSVMFKKKFVKEYYRI